MSAVARAMILTAALFCVAISVQAQSATKEAKEAAGNDIRVSQLSKTYTATGRIVYAETGAPAPNALCVLSGTVLTPESLRYRTDAGGNLRMEGLLPGRYSVIYFPDDENDYYSDRFFFQVTDQDVSGLEIKLQRGASLRGVAVIENTGDPAVFARMSKLQFLASLVESGWWSRYCTGGVDGEPNGSFRRGAIPPGKVKISLLKGPDYPDHKGFHLIRVERGGIDVSEGIEVLPGDAITGLRAIIAYGTGRIEGELKLAERDLPKNLSLIFNIYAFRVGDGDRQPFASTHIYEAGRFVIEELPAGEYELSVRPGVTPASSMGILPNQVFKHPVTVTDQAESQVTITIDLKIGDR